MTVSIDHQNLIELLEHWCSERVNRTEHVFLTDSVGRLGSESPPKVGGYKPDLLCMTVTGEYVFLGDAKTEGDLSTSHTRNQLTAFLKSISGNERALLVLAVPWGCEGAAFSLLQHIQRSIGQTRKQWAVISNAPR